MCALYARVRGTCTSIRVNLIVGLMGAGEQGAAYTTLPGSNYFNIFNKHEWPTLAQTPLCVFKNYIPDMLPVHNVSIHRCCTHWWCSHFCVVTSILCHPSRYSYCCLKTSEMITLEKHDHSSGGPEKSATKSWVWVECQHFECTFQNSATQAWQL